MKRYLCCFINGIAIICVVFSLFSIFNGDMTNAPEKGFSKLYKSENLNDVHSIAQDTNGNIYTLGYNCVQKFNNFGKFIGGAYYDSNHTKQIKNYQFLSLNRGNIVVFNRRSNVVYVFNGAFDVVDKIEVNELYGEKEFYSDYPNTDALNIKIKLSPWNNTISHGEEIIKLEAPRNMLFSRNVGLLTLFVSIMVVLITNRQSQL